MSYPGSEPRTPVGGAAKSSGAVRLPDKVGHFKIHGLLGRGGMGVVLDASTPEGERVALKLIRPQGDVQKTRIVSQRFLREAKILAKLNHPSVVKLIDSGDLDGLLYLAMERIEGISLLAIRRRGPVGYHALVALGARLSDALAHMHAQGVLHRDIKPANVLIDISGRPVITDFGISYSDEETGITRLGDLLGSPGFMAPEVTEGEIPTERADQYALGRLLFELGATGQPMRLPLDAPILELLAQSLKMDWSRLPQTGEWAQLQKILHKMTAKKPADRFATASDVCAAFRQIGWREVGDFDTLSGELRELREVASDPWDAHNAERDERVEEARVQSQPEVPAPVSAPELKRPPSALVDDLIADLERPAGERSYQDPASRHHHEKRSEADDAPGMEDTVATRRELPSFEAWRKLAESKNLLPKPQKDDGEKTLDDLRMPSLVMPLPEASIMPLLEPAPSPPDPPNEPYTTTEPEAPAGDLRRAFAPPDRGILVTEGKPLSRILTDRVHGSANPVAARAELTELPAEAQLPRLHRQIEAMRDQIAELRKRPGGKTSLVRAVGASAGTLVIGLLIGLVVPTAPRDLATIVLTPAKTAVEAEPLFMFRQGKGSGNPTALDIQDAQNMLDTARAYLKKRDWASAERYLALCIEIADLPDCHKTLATILALVDDPAARTHFEHYLRIAPSALDSSEIRRGLKGQ